MNSDFREKYPSVKDITVFPLSKLIVDYSHELLNSQTLASGFGKFIPKLLQQKQQLHNVKNPLAFITNQIKPNRFFPRVDVEKSSPHTGSSYAWILHSPFISKYFPLAEFLPSLQLKKPKPNNIFYTIKYN